MIALGTGLLEDLQVRGRGGGSGGPGPERSVFIPLSIFPIAAGRRRSFDIESPVLAIMQVSITLSRWNRGVLECYY